MSIEYINTYLVFHKVCYLVLNGFTKEVLELHFNDEVWFCFGDQIFCWRCIVLTSLKCKIDKTTYRPYLISSKCHPLLQSFVIKSIRCRSLFTLWTICSFCPPDSPRKIYNFSTKVLQHFGKNLFAKHFLGMSFS